MLNPSTGNRLLHTLQRSFQSHCQLHSCRMSTFNSSHICYTNFVLKLSDLGGYDHADYSRMTMDKLLWFEGEFLNISCTRKRFVFKESCKCLQLLVNVEALAGRDFFCVPQGPIMGPCPNAKYPIFSQFD